MRLNLLLAGATAGALLLYFFPPQAHAFYPRCLFFHVTGLYCPGCGSTRAIACLLHGGIAEALHYNALAVALLPLLIGFFALAYWPAVMRHQAPLLWPRLPLPVVKVLLVAVAAFTVARNVIYLLGGAGL